MKIANWRGRKFALGLLLLCAGGMPAASELAAVAPLFDLRTPEGAPFPSNRFTVPDQRQLTSLRINLPKPDCAQRPSDCNDIDVLNTLDGFNLQPRLRIPFSGPINPASVNSSSVFLLRLRNVVTDTKPQSVIGINQVVWDPLTNTLLAKSNELLDQHVVYALIVTTDVRDSSGTPIVQGDFASFLNSFSTYPFADNSAALGAYRNQLLDAVQRAGIAQNRIATASLFTTLSATAEMEKIRNQVNVGTVSAMDFALGSDGSRTVFRTANITGITISRQLGAARFQEQPLPLSLLGPMASSVGRIGFGRFTSPDYQTEQRSIPALGTRSGVPVIQRTNSVYFTIAVPSGARPDTGWPVAIYGHGFGSNKDTVLAFSAVLASRGFVTIGINVVGHGGGGQGTITVNRSNATPVTFPAGGRGIDQNGDGNIESTEGFDAAPPMTLINNRDGLRQTVVDLMQLARTISLSGIDITGDGACDINSSRIYYFGISLGGIYGPMFMAVDSQVRAGVANAGGGSLIEVGRQGAFRGIPATSLATRSPPLLNTSPLMAPAFGFNENTPLRNRNPLTNNVPGAIAIQDYFERREWAAQPGDPLSFVRHVRKEPLAGNVAKPIIVQFARGDRTVPNPTTSAMIRAGGLTDVATYFRADLAVAAMPTFPRDPHTFLAGITAPVTTPVAIAAQTQIAEFLASDGMTIIDPDGAEALFETPIAGSLPEELNFLQ